MLEASVGSRMRRREQLLTALAWSGALVVVGLLSWLLIDVVVQGAGALSWSFLTDSPLTAGRAGGIAPVLAATAGILLVCLGVAVPLGTGTAIYLAELAHGRRNWFGRTVRRSLDVLASVPSIVFGLFGNVFFCQVLGLGFSILSGGLTLACMVLPTLIRTIEAALRAAPDELRRGAAALALSRTTTLRRLLLPAAAPGIAAGVVLGVGRALAETAALIYTSGYVSRMPVSVLDSGRSLSVHIYDLAMNVPGGNRNAYGSALVLIAALVVINHVACVLTDRLTRGGKE